MKSSPNHALHKNEQRCFRREQMGTSHCWRVPPHEFPAVEIYRREKSSPFHHHLPMLKFYTFRKLSFLDNISAICKEHFLMQSLDSKDVFLFCTASLLNFASVTEKKKGPVFSVEFRFQQIQHLRLFLDVKKMKCVSLCPFACFSCFWFSGRAPGDGKTSGHVLEPSGVGGRQAAGCKGPEMGCEF